MVPVVSCQCVVFPSDRFDCIRSAPAAAHDQLYHQLYQVYLDTKPFISPRADIKGAVSRYSVIFCAFFLREQKMAVARASVADMKA